MKANLVNFGYFAKISHTCMLLTDLELDFDLHVLDEYIYIASLHFVYFGVLGVVVLGPAKFLEPLRYIAPVSLAVSLFLFVCFLIECTRPSNMYILPPLGTSTKLDC